MRRATNNKGDMLNMVIFPYDQMGKFNEFKKQYENIPHRQVYREIVRVKSSVSEEVLNKHMKNLDALAQMEGFFTEEHKERIETVKDLLSLNSTSLKSRNSHNSGVEAEYVSGTSLLLWFLILVAIW